ncbi:MAG: PD-(D/E)XK nuclease family protein [Treponema sp.]|jgi:RecB family exonuclease|nr:PD-(D/E)XK nuclease family protein [Treponema sp.]
MNRIITILNREIPRPESRFVFPSEAAASAWSEKICRITGIRSLARSRFLAWDRFKEAIIRADVQDREPISKVIRRLFTLDLIRRNAQAVQAGGGTGADTLPFRSIIPVEHAQEGAVFGDQLAAILPSLRLLRKRQEAFPQSPDDEDRDFLLLEREYREFLDRRRLFEPSWENPPLKDRDHRYFIFFPEAVEDYAEYAATLEAESAIIQIIPIETPEEPELLYRFPNSREEIRAAVLEIRRLHEEARIPYEEMALSVPDLPILEPYLLRELALYHLPVRKRYGRPLAEHETGGLFALIQACAGENFSFSALKSLLLNAHIPWRYGNLNRELILFGIRHNCVSGYHDRQGRPVDVWLEAFARSPQDETLCQYYKGLKKALRSMTEAKSFTSLRNQYFAFRGAMEEKNSGTLRAPRTFKEFLAMDRISAEGNAVLARCVEELSALMRLEEAYTEILPPRPFDFYLTVLREKQYVPQQTQGGVNVFPYRVAASAPFRAHLVLNASQRAATVLYQPLRFLRQDKRNRFGLADQDASGDFFRLYRLNPYTPEAAAATSALPEGFAPYTWISAAEEAFTGWTIPHSYFFAGAKPGENMLPGKSGASDPFVQERNWWAGRGPFPDRLFPLQAGGFDRWQSLLGPERRFNLLADPFPAQGPARSLVWEQLYRLQWEREYLKVSATDLTLFYTCRTRWLFQKVFGLAVFSLEARLLDDAFMGNLYHLILKNLFTRIQEEDGQFTAAHIPRYHAWIREYTLDGAAHFYPFQGPLAKPLLESQAAAMMKKLRALVNAEGRRFPGYQIAALEWEAKAIQGDMLLVGRLDRLSRSPQGEAVIIDYKTNAMPSKAGSMETEEKPLRDFQMPMYVKLFEAQGDGTNRAGGAFFMSISKDEKSNVTEVLGGGKGVSREDFQPTLDALDGYIAAFGRAAGSMNFLMPRRDLRACNGCLYKTICRTAFSLNAEA